MELIKKCGTSVILGVGTPQLVEEDEDSDWRNQTEEVGFIVLFNELSFQSPHLDKNLYTEWI